MAAFLSSAPLELSVSGRPVLLDSEVEIKAEAGVDVYHQKGKTVLFPKCSIVLTNYRLLCLQESCGVSLELETISSVEDLTTLLRHSSRIRLICSNGDEIELKFVEGGKEAFLAHLRAVLKKRSWEQRLESALVQSKKSAESSFSGRTAGVSGLIRKRQQELKGTDAMAESALSDLDSLMAHARDIVAVVQKYSTIMAESQTPEGVSETSTEVGERNEMESILQNIGIMSPVTKLSAGRLYHQHLAQQLADLLRDRNILARLGGMVTVTDVYCIYNRARGTELVSPEDFYQAVLMLEKLPALNLCLKEFDSGVRVIADSSLSMSKIYERIAHLAAESPFDGISISELAGAFQVSITIAKEQMNLAEREGYLCRDDTFSGMQYFENKFNSF